MNSVRNLFIVMSEWRACLWASHELSCHPGVFFSNVILNHGFLSSAVNALLKFGGDGTGFQVDLGSSASDDGYLAWVRSGVGVLFHGKSVGM